MDKSLQDLAWSILPKEFKEEVKKVVRLYSGRTSALFGAERHLANKFLDEFIRLFGYPNLTSDAEGEDEMLTVPRSKVQELYKEYCAERDKEEPGSNRSSLGGRIAMLQELFGSKCLPEE